MHTPCDPDSGGACPPPCRCLWATVRQAGHTWGTAQRQESEPQAPSMPESTVSVSCPHVSGETAKSAWAQEPQGGGRRGAQLLSGIFGHSHETQTACLSQVATLLPTCRFTRGADSSPLAGADACRHTRVTRAGCSGLCRASGVGPRHKGPVSRQQEERPRLAQALGHRGLLPGLRARKQKQLPGPAHGAQLFFLGATRQGV